MIIDVVLIRDIIHNSVELCGVSCNDFDLIQSRKAYEERDSFARIIHVTYSLTGFADIEPAKNGFYKLFEQLLSSARAIKLRGKESHEGLLTIYSRSDLEIFQEEGEECYGFHWSGKVGRYE